jgi:hypothetical protein
MSRLNTDEQAEYDALDGPAKRKWTLARKKRLRQERIDAGLVVSKDLLPKKKVRGKRSTTGKRRTKVAVEQEMVVASKSKTPQQIRGALAALLTKHNVDPLEELIIMTKSSKMNAKEKKEIYKFLVPFQTPTLKAIDMQQDIKMNVSVTTQSFADATMHDLKQAEPVDESDYDEFITDDNKILMDETPDLTESETDVLLDRN